jgi:hypothetical protein
MLLVPIENAPLKIKKSIFYFGNTAEKNRRRLWQKSSGLLACASALGSRPGWRLALLPPVATNAVRVILGWRRRKGLRQLEASECRNPKAKLYRISVASQ